MMRGSFLLVVLVMIVAAAVIVVALVMAYRRRRSAAITSPICGACGYHLAPNPAGLTVCPECGGDFLSVGILAPNMKLGQRGSPAVPLGIAWFVLVGVGMVPLHGQLVSALTRTVSTTTVSLTSSGTGPFSAVGASVRRVQVAGETKPDTLTADVTITWPAGKETVLTIDGVTRAITAAPAGSGLVGQPWDAATTAKLIAANSGDGASTPDEDSAKRLHSIVADALSKTAGGAGPGVLAGVTSFSSSSGGIVGGRPSRSYREFASSSNSSSSNAPTVVIGPLRGAHWVTLITCVGGLLLACAGLWIIVLMTRGRRAA